MRRRGSQVAPLLPRISIFRRALQAGRKGQPDSENEKPALAMDAFIDAPNEGVPTAGADEAQPHTASAHPPSLDGRLASMADRQKVDWGTARYFWDTSDCAWVVERICFRPPPMGWGIVSKNIYISNRNNRIGYIRQLGGPMGYRFPTEITER